MAESRLIVDWDGTSATRSMMYNTNLPKGKKPLEWHAGHPWRGAGGGAKRIRITADNIEKLKVLATHNG